MEVEASLDPKLEEEELLLSLELEELGCWDWRRSWRSCASYVLMDEADELSLLESLESVELLELLDWPGGGPGGAPGGGPFGPPWPESEESAVCKSLKADCAPDRSSELSACESSLMASLTSESSELASSREASELASEEVLESLAVEDEELEP